MLKLRIADASIEDTALIYSAATDPELRDWLHWAIESGQARLFVKTVAEAACIADAPNYARLRPLLLELKQEV